MHFFPDRSFKFLLILSILVIVLFYIKNVYTQPPPPPPPPASYIISAHGNVSYGVNRTGLSSFGYSIGNCGHCHEQHASIGGAEPAPAGGNPSKYALFKGLFTDQTDTFCYGCHKDSGSEQSSMVPQYNYSHIAGGYTGTTPNDVKEAFQQTSSHDLAAIQTFIRNKWNFDNTLGNNNPCSGCHNPHRAKRDHHSTSGTPTRTDGSGNLIISSVSRPIRHNKDNNVWDLWGDQSGERMRDYSLTNGVPYQSPYRYLSANTYEPDGSGTITNGSNLFDTVQFCLDCHSQSVGGSVNIVINWGPIGNVHGLAPTTNCCNFGNKKAPFPADPASPTAYPNYVLSCLDCHEPHGSPNPRLLREEVNGTYVGTFSGTVYWNFCSACHQNINTTPPYHSGLTSGSSCPCHNHSVVAGVGCWPAVNCNSFGLPGCATAVCDGNAGQVPGL